jgi:hypothetical protein
VILTETDVTSGFLVYYLWALSCIWLEYEFHLILTDLCVFIVLPDS